MKLEKGLLDLLLSGGFLLPLFGGEKRGRLWRKRHTYHREVACRKRLGNLKKTPSTRKWGKERGKKGVRPAETTSGGKNLSSRRGPQTAARGLLVLGRERPPTEVDRPTQCQ